MIQFSMVLPHKIHISLFVRFSQPAHFTGLVLVACLAFLLVPERPAFPWEPSPFSWLLYISSFATHFGTQIWMTFISGIVLFFNLPRKLFGMVQRQLFPKYFLLNSVLGFITLMTFILHNQTQAEELVMQKSALAVCLLCDIVAMSYIVPNMIVTMETRAVIEQQFQQSGVTDLSQLQKNTKYIQLHKRFRKLHGVCAIVNFIAMFCNFVHVYHLAWKLRSVMT